MTTAELGRLLHALVGDITVREAVNKYKALSDDDLALLVRWVAGERTTQAPPPAAPAGRDPETVDGYDLDDVTMLG